MARDISMLTLPAALDQVAWARTATKLHLVTTGSEPGRGHGRLLYQRREVP